MRGARRVGRGRGRERGWGRGRAAGAAAAAAAAGAALLLAAAPGGAGAQALRVPPAGACELLLRELIPGAAASGSLEACVAGGPGVPGAAAPEACCDALDRYFGYSSEGFLGCPCLQQVWFQMMQAAGPRLGGVLQERMQTCRVPHLDLYGCPAGGSVLPVLPRLPEPAPFDALPEPVPFVAAPEPVCADDDPRCEFWSSLGECELNPDWMCTNCCSSCSGDTVCAPEPVIPSPPPLPPPLPLGRPPAVLFCVDDAAFEADCPGWAGLGECQRNPEFMLEACRASCGNCQGNVCQSKDPVNCPVWASAGLCVEQPEFMCDHCCQQCFVFPQCEGFRPEPPAPPPSPGGGYVNPNTLRIRQKLNQTQEIAHQVEQGLIFQTGLVESMNQLRNGAVNLVVAEQIVEDVWDRRNSRNRHNTRGRKDERRSIGDRVSRVGGLFGNFNPW